MTQSSKTAQFIRLFERERRPGDLVFAVVFFGFATFLLAVMPFQTIWAADTALYAQPRLWPAVSIGGMAIFGGLHWFSSASSPRIDGRWAEVWLWIRSFEYGVWFLAYVAITPIIGYLLATILLGVLLMLRVGLRSPKALLCMSFTGFIIVLIFKSILHVNLPGGAIYELLPTTWRSFMLTYF